MAACGRLAAVRKNHTLITLAALSLTACGGDESTGGNTIDATGDVQTKVQTALINAKPGDTITFKAGTYAFKEELSLTVSGVTLKGESRDTVIFDFAQQTTGNANGFSARDVTGLVIDGITFRDSVGDGVRIERSKNITVRNVKVLWTGGSATDNGAYGIYPVRVENILIDNVDVRGASDAGIYVGQSMKAVVKNSHVEGNMTGIEIENTDDAEVVGNTAVDNVSGILVFNLPNLGRKTGSRTKVHDNTIMANNRAPFAVAGSIVSYVPPGTGMIMLANDDGEVHNNTITGNKSTGIIVVSCATVEILTEGAVNCADSMYDPYEEGLYVHDNTFSGNATTPVDTLAAWWLDRSKPFFDILWDGITDPSKPNADGKLNLCIQNNGSATFAQINTSQPGTVVSTSLETHACTHPALPAVQVTW